MEYTDKRKLSVAQLPSRNVILLTEHTLTQLFEKN